jgi:hypothetical protein
LIGRSGQPGWPLSFMPQVTQDVAYVSAGFLAGRYGKKLIGRKVETFAYGEWPDCVAVITEVAPDPAAPEIVFNVKNDGTHGELVEIGVFDHETVGFISDPGHRVRNAPRKSKPVRKLRRIDLD